LKARLLAVVFLQDERQAAPLAVIYNRAKARASFGGVCPECFL